MGDYYQEMELLLVRAGIREDVEEKMAQFLHYVNDDISAFVEMFPYNNLQHYRKVVNLRGSKPS
jgi:hypothetical protein